MHPPPERNEILFHCMLLNDKTFDTQQIIKLSATEFWCVGGFGSIFSNSSIPFFDYVKLQQRQNIYYSIRYVQHSDNDKPSQADEDK